MASDPYPKTRQLARGEKRYRRKVASPKQWQAIRAAKCLPGYCRICGPTRDAIHAHHLLARVHGGDDTPPNIVGLCPACHDFVTRGDKEHLAVLASLLTDEERGYLQAKLGEHVGERLFGV